MIDKKLIISLFILVTIVQSQPLPGFDQLKSDYPSFKLGSEQIFQEAQQELCPFPGYHGNYCPQQQYPFYTQYKRQLQQNGAFKMPSGIGASFDITTGELKLPAIQLTYQENASQEQIWQDPNSNISYVIADETVVQQIDSQADVKIFRNEFELGNIWLEATQRGQWLGGEYSSSKDMNEVFERFFKGQQETSIAQLTKNVVRLTFKSDDLRLNRFAQRAVNSLPQEFNQEVYDDFFNSWGTHISVDTHIGGMIEKQTVFKDCVYSTPSFTGGLSPDQLEQALHNELHGNQGDGYFAARRRVSIDHKFGGNPEDVQNWESTISQNPALLKINRFISWENFISDPQIKANLQQAIQNRVESMIQRQNSYKTEIQEQRRIQRLGPKTAYAISGQGKIDNQQSNIDINEAFWMKEASQCTPGLPFEISKSRCSSGDMIDTTTLLKFVRYERDDYGNYRTVMYDFIASMSAKAPVNIFGNWVERGCSIGQPNYVPQFTDFNYPPPDGSWFKIICTDCIPGVSYTPNGAQLQCNCPSF